MHCIEVVDITSEVKGQHEVPKPGPDAGWVGGWGLRLVALLLTGGCASPVVAPTAPARQAPTAAPAAPPPIGKPAAAVPKPPAPTAAAAAHRRARDWDEYRLFAAQRIVAANPDGSHVGQVVEPLLAIPVLDIELNADGSVRRISVLRQPRQALDTVQLAIDAVRRAAPFGTVSHLPKPWRFSEVFLFGDDRRFKPRTLDL